MAFINKTVKQAKKNDVTSSVHFSHSLLSVAQNLYL